jgi:hypothetical protein
MAKKLQDLLESVLNDGARPAKYFLKIALPIQDNDVEHSIPVLAKTATLPGKTLDTIGFQYKGRNIPLPGQVKYAQTWEMTLLAEEDHSTRIYFMDWIQGMDNANSSYYISQGSELTGEIRGKRGATEQRKVDITISQLNFDLSQVEVDYVLYNCFPISVGDISVGHELVGAIEEYSVTFSFSHCIIKYATDTSYPYSVN